MHEKIAESYSRRMVEKAEAMPAPATPHRQQAALGPIITPQQLQRVDRIVRESVAALLREKCGLHDPPSTPSRIRSAGLS